MDGVAVTGNGALILVLLLLSCRAGENCIEDLMFIVLSIISFITKRYFIVLSDYIRSPEHYPTHYLYIHIFFYKEN